MFLPTNHCEFLRLAPRVSWLSKMENVLRECAEKLLNAANNLVSNPPTSTASSTTSSTATTAHVSTTTAGTLAEHRRIFNFRPPLATGGSRRPNGARSQSAIRGKTTRPYFIPQSSTRTFVCLARKDQMQQPTAQEKIALSKAEPHAYKANRL